MEESFLIEVSARHVHLDGEAVRALFGDGYSLKFKKELSQPGQFVCEERVSLVGPKNTIKNVVVLGPLRDQTQVEVSATDARNLGLAPPIKESGDLEGSCFCRLVGPCGELEISKGLIIAKRHLHANFEDAARLNIENGSLIWVKVDSRDRSLIFGDVVVRVSDNFSLAMHIDTDEANAAGCGQNFRGTVFNFR